MGEYEKTICELFDNCPNGQQIRAIAGMYHIDVEDVKDILKANGRKLPRGGRPKAIIKESAPQEEKQKEAPVANIPDAVKNLVFNRIDDLENQLSDINERIKKLESARQQITSEYKVLADYISLPFGAGNLSHKGSDNMIESPQADA